MNKWLKIILPLIYGFTLLSLAVYSYTQIDLNLTLSSNPIYQSLQRGLIQIGYYNRPLSVLIYIIILSLLFILYLLLLKMSQYRKNEILKIIFILISVNLFFSLVSYPAFSHDFFNYLFDARIVTKYHENPYLFKALDFPDDLWTRFMHWTHRTYPYGPLWLIMTIPFSFLGFGKFVLTSFLFKSMFAGIYLLNSILVWQIASKINNKAQYTALIFFAFNPLIVIESLISPHNEGLMLLFFLLSLKLLFLRKNKILSFIIFLSSVLVKYVTLILAPLYLIKNAYIKSVNLVRISVVLLLVPLFLEIYYREAYPWYFVPLLGVGALSFSNSIYGILSALSLGAMLRYIPYLYSGAYFPENYKIMDLLLITPVFFWLSSKMTNMIIIRLKSA